MAALARVRARWRRPSLSWLAAVVLLLLLLCSPAARARRIEYFDLESRPLPLPNPPGLVLGPMGNNTLRETRDIVVLADGASNARPMRAWDAAVLRTFVVKEGYRQFLTLLNARDERVFHVDLGTIEFDLNQKRISSGGRCVAYHTCACMCLSKMSFNQSAQHRKRDDLHAYAITTHPQTSMATPFRTWPSA